jgi:hypothetical protein
VNLDGLVFTREFACPHCSKKIRVSPRYKRNMELTSWILGLLIPYLFGVRSWFVLLCWIPCTMAALFIWAWAGKYFLPPKLERCVFEPPSVLGLGPK